MSRFSTAALAAALIICAGPAGFLAYRLAIGGRASAPLLQGVGRSSGGAAQTSGPVQAAPAAHPIPERLPAVALPDAQGVEHRLTDWQGKPLLVNFWATWCEPCRREIPLLQRLRRQYAPAGLQVVGIAVDMRDAVVPFARKMGIDYPVLIGEEGGLAALEAFGMEPAFPFSVFADGQGRIVAIKMGELHPEEADLILGRVRRVDSGELALAQARAEIQSGLRELATERAKRSAEAADKGVSRS